MRAKALILLISILSPFIMNAQSSGNSSVWSLTDCIQYALEQNIQVRQSILTNVSNQVNKELADAQKLPSLSASLRQNFSWSNVEDIVSDNSSFSGTNSSSYSVNSSIILYNGSRLNNLIRQAELDMQSGIYDSETIKESITINILNAYLLVLFTSEQVKNAGKQIEATNEQVNLTEERLKVGIISMSDYLQVKSQLASEKLSLASANSQYAIARISLIQLMELTVSDDFTIIDPVLDESINQYLTPAAAEVYAIALSIKPEIRSAEYRKESAAMNEIIAASGYYPTVSADAGVGTAYTNFSEKGYFSQLNNQFSPSFGLAVSIPIFQKKQVKSNVSQAKINYQNAELQERDTRNQLRKGIEQACVDVISGQYEYEASNEKFNSTNESYNLAEEKFNNGLINSVDFLFEKTNQIVAESDLSQAKYTLIFRYKILDFYLGNPITF